MRLRTKLAALGAAACMFALGVFVATSVGSGGSGYSAASPVRLDHASPAGKLVPEKGGGGEPAIRHFLADKRRAVQAGDADLVGARCPNKFPNPITGGAFTSGPGLAVVNLSAKNPGGNTKARHYYIAVLNLSGGTLQWKPEATCGKNIKD